MFTFWKCNIWVDCHFSHSVVFDVEWKSFGANYLLYAYYGNLVSHIPYLASSSTTKNTIELEKQQSIKILSSLLLALWSHIKSHNCCPMNIQWSNPKYTLVDLFCVSSFFLISGLSLLWEKLLSLSLQLPSLFVCVGCEMPPYSYIPLKLLPSVVLWISL